MSNDLFLFQLLLAIVSVGLLVYAVANRRSSKPDEEPHSGATHCPDIIDIQSPLALAYKNKTVALIEAQHAAEKAAGRDVSSAMIASLLPLIENVPLSSDPLAFQRDVLELIASQQSHFSTIKHEHANAAVAALDTVTAVLNESLGKLHGAPSDSTRANDEAKNCPVQEQLQLTAFDDYLRTLEHDIGCPLPSILIPRDREWRTESEGLWQAGQASLEDFLLQDALAELPELAPVDHGLIGVWGHGANSYALYISFKTSNAFVHLRLPFGGAYANHEKQKTEIARFLPYVAGLLAALKPGEQLVLVQSMGAGISRLVTAAGEVVAGLPSKYVG